MAAPKKPLFDHILEALRILGQRWQSGFLELGDVNGDYPGNATKVFVVSPTEDGLEVSDALELKDDIVKILGARFVSDGGDNGGAYDGGYNLYIGEECGQGVVYPGLYGVNAFYGYGAGRDFGGAQSTLLGAGSGRESRTYSGEYQENPALDDSGSMVAVGSSAGRDILKINSSLLVGQSAASFNDHIYRSCFFGNFAGINKATGSFGGVRRNYTRCLGLGSHALSLANGDHKDVVAIGFESGLYSSLEKSILIGTYSGFTRDQQGGFQADNVIHIGHRINTVGSEHPGDLPPVNNTIVVGNDTAPEQENTVVFPVGYDMGLGTLTPSSKLDVVGDIEVGLNDHFYFGDPATDGSFRFKVVDGQIQGQKREQGAWIDLDNTNQSRAAVAPAGPTSQKYPANPVQIVQDGLQVQISGGLANDSGGTIEAGQVIASFPVAYSAPYPVLQGITRVDNTDTPALHWVKVENEQVTTLDPLNDGDYLLLNSVQWLVPA